jgi:hypothetical protein
VARKLFGLNAQGHEQTAGEFRELSPWLAMALIVGGLVGVAVAMLAVDLLRGDVGGRHTMARAPPARRRDRRGDERASLGVGA